MHGSFAAGEVSKYIVSDGQGDAETIVSGLQVSLVDGHKDAHYSTVGVERRWTWSGRMTGWKHRGTFAGGDGCAGVCTKVANQRLKCHVNCHW